VGKAFYAHLRQRRQRGYDGARKHNEDATMVAAEGQ
jgi:hypothetical protein